MDLDHLKKLVLAAHDEETDGPAFDALLEYLNEAHADPALARIAYGVVIEIKAMLENVKTERNNLREQLAAMTAARDEACEIARKLLDESDDGICVLCGWSLIERDHAMKNCPGSAVFYARIAELSKVGS